MIYAILVKRDCYLWLFMIENGYYRFMIFELKVRVLRNRFYFELELLHF